MFEPFTVTVLVSVGRGKDSATGWSVGADGSVKALDAVPTDPDLTLTVSPSDAELLQKGELSPAAAYMQGRLKPAGDNALWLTLTKFSTTPEYEALRVKAVRQGMFS
jgi:putative sterol carrier protein